MSYLNCFRRERYGHARNDARNRILRFENLEAREMLSVSPLRDAQAAATAAIVTTALDLSDPNDGLTSLREALASSSVATIAFAPSLQGQTITLTSELTVSSNVAIDASSLWNDELNSPGLTIDANYLGRALSASRRDVTLTGLRFVNGRTSDGGGAVYAYQSNLTINSCVFEKNEAYRGGAIYAYQSPLALTNVVFSENVATYGGGAICASSSHATILNAKFVGNSAENQGGALYLTGEGSSASIANALAADNVSSWGGFAGSWGGAITLRNATIANNSAASGGGAVYISGAPINAYNSIFAGNSASWSDDVQRTSTTFNAYNCLVSGYVFDNSDDNIFAREGESLFLAPENGDYRLSPHSRAVDAGIAQYAVAPDGSPLQTDLRGAARTVGVAIDLGAYEYDPTIDPYVEPKRPDTYVDFIVSEPHYDADKYMDDSDSNQCWAGSVSSMLWSTGWGRLDGLTDEEDLFHQKFGANFPNQGYNENWAIGWFLNNDYYANQVREPGGYYASLFTKYDEPTTLYRASTDAYGADAMLEAATRLRSGVAVGFAINSYNQTTGAGGCGHALTAYGYAYDPALDPSDPNYYTRIYYVDSNDGGRMTGQRDRKLRALEIEWTENIKIGAEIKSGYVVKNYGMGNPATDLVVIYDFTYLAQRPSKYAPDGGASANLYLAETLDDKPLTFTSTEAGTLNSTTFLQGEEVVANFSFQSTTNLATSASATCQILVDDKPIATVDVGDVAKGASRTFSVSLGRLDAGVHFVTVVVDSEGVVEESNENDNAVTTAITISADEYVVVNTASDVVDPNDGLTSLREALAIAGAFGKSSRVAFDESLRGATISVDAGIIEVERDIVVDATALWNAEDARPGVTISANGKSSIFEVKNGAEVRFVGLELSDGEASWGGALNLKNVAVTLDRCWLTNNKATNGGAINVSNSDLVILNSVVQGNSATDQGGAIYLWNSDRSVYVANSLFVNNSADWGGVAMNWGVDMTFANVTLVKNAATQGGGVMYADKANLLFYNSILALNTASWSKNIQWGDVTITGYNSIASDNIWTQGANNLTSATKALFTNADADDFSLANDSVAIDYGVNEYAIDANGGTILYDLGGADRISNSTVDAGAYEYQVRSQLTTPAFTTSSTARSITVEWNATPDASGYEVVCDETSVRLDVNRSNYTFENLVPSTSYVIAVRALGDGDAFLDSAKAAVVVTTLDELGAREGQAITLTVDVDPNASVYWDFGDGVWRKSGAARVVDPEEYAFTPGRSILTCRTANEQEPFYSIELDVTEATPSINVESLDIANDRAAIYRIETNFAGRIAARDWRVDWGDGTFTIYSNQYAFTAAHVYASATAKEKRNISVALLDATGATLYSATIDGATINDDVANALLDDSRARKDAPARDDDATPSVELVRNLFERGWTLDEFETESTPIDEIVARGKSYLAANHFVAFTSDADWTLDESLDMDLTVF